MLDLKATQNEKNYQLIVACASSSCLSQQMLNTAGGLQLWLVSKLIFLLYRLPLPRFYLCLGLKVFAVASTITNPMICLLYVMVNIQANGCMQNHRHAKGLQLTTNTLNSFEFSLIKSVPRP